MGTYIFSSERLGFREWKDDDLPRMAAINSDPAVMEFFPGLQTEAATMEFIETMRQKFALSRYCYFAVDRLDTGAFIGFTGLSDKTFEGDFTPCVDIGWRISSDAWGSGYATEGALRCLEYAFGELDIQKIVSMAPAINLKSVNVMKKIGMKKMGNFVHPLLLSDARLRNCVLYQIENSINFDK